MRNAGGVSGDSSGGISVWASVDLSTPASALPAATGGSAGTAARRWAAGALLLAVVFAAAGCTSAAKKHQAAPSRTGSSPVAASTSTSTGAPRPATTPVPPPTSGDIKHTVAVHAPSVKPAVALTAPGDFGSRVSAHIESIRAATTQARGPGEVSGPGLVVTVRIDNGSTKAIDLGNVVVALTGSTGAPASPMSADPAHPFTATLAAGSHAIGVYVFTIPKADRKPVTLRVSYTAGAPVVVFVGDAP